jgi:hypothetical protein
MPIDLSAGYAADAEQVVLDRPDIPFWSENMLFAVYDRELDIGLWMHLGTMPTDWGFWEDRVLLSLPGDGGVLTQRSYLRTPAERRPGAANLTATCLEPFRRWRVEFDGWGVRTPYERMRTRLVEDGVQEPFSVDLEVTATTPVWNLHQAAEHASGKGSMREQSWATEHYEQVYRAVGSVRLPDGKELAFDGTGWRDHSRGPRGAGTGRPWGGHVIIGAYLPESGRAMGLCRYYAADGSGVTLEGGYVVQDGVLHHATVTGASRLTELRKDGERLHFGLSSEAGELTVDAVTRTSMFTMLRSSRHYYGIDPSGELGMVYVLNFAEWEWDGESATLYVERSDPMAVVGS